MTPQRSRPLTPLICGLLISLSSAACGPHHTLLKRYIEDGTGSPSEINASIARMKKSHRDTYRGEEDFGRIDRKSEREAWNLARRAGQRGAIERFQLLYPNGSFSMAAADLKMKLDLLELEAAPTPENISEFILKHPAIELPHKFDGAIAEMEFRKAESLNRGQAWEIFIAQYPDSPRTEEARTQYLLHIARVAEEFSERTPGRPCRRSRLGAARAATHERPQLTGERILPR